MTLNEYGRVLKDRWTWILAVLLVVTLGAVAYSILRAPKFTAVTTLYVAAQSDTNSAQAAYQGSLLSEQRITSYVELATSPRVLQQVINELQLPVTPDLLAKQISASNKVDSVLLDVSVTWDDPQDAANIANAVGQILPQVINELERPADPRLPAAIAVRQVAPVGAPLEPSGTSPLSLVAAGLVGGLLLGCGVALLVNVLDTRVKNREDLRKAANAPVLATIGANSAAEAATLDLSVALRGSAADDYKSLRTNLTFSNVDDPATTIAVTSSLPGEGKTTTSCLLGAALAAAGSKVLLVDADLRRPALANRLSIEPRVGLTTVLSNRVDLAEAVQPSRITNLDVLASGEVPANPSEILASASMSNLLREARRSYDYVVVDTAPVLPVPDTLALTNFVDGTILLCRTDRTRKVDTREACDRISSVSGRLLGTVLTMSKGLSRSAYNKYGYYSSLNEEESHLAPSVVAPARFPSTSAVRSTRSSDAIDTRADTINMDRRSQPTPAPRASPPVRGPHGP
ncbi:polysaccharide biosynthesis tyrosine autokinase [Actinomycetospora sp. NBRC 106378]|uniref:polysaccharide biosynthesis tyrosine autokinase n=1 Tax=Actinomycetospora sp. NBRC 106378 TaxID=3032208 RepID=UPI00332A925F